MQNLILTLSDYLAYPFVRYALVAGILIAMSASLLGVTLVLKRYSFIGDGLSHVAFGAMAIAAVLNTVDIFIVMPIIVVFAIILLRSGSNAKIKGDAAIAVVSVSALAIGYLIMNIFSKSPNVSGDVCSSLFGSTSILTLSRNDVALCVIMSLLVLVVFVFMYNKLFAVTFDEAFSKASGINTSFYNTLIAVITAIIVVLAMRIVGSLLTSALIIFPALSAMRVFKSFKSVIICAGVISVVSTFIGMIVSIILSVPVGAMIVLVDLLVFAIFSIVGKLMRG